jgi:hypothetical protein
VRIIMVQIIKERIIKVGITMERIAKVTIVGIIKERTTVVIKEDIRTMVNRVK